MSFKFTSSVSLLSRGRIVLAITSVIMIFILMTSWNDVDNPELDSDLSTSHTLEPIRTITTALLNEPLTRNSPTSVKRTRRRRGLGANGESLDAAPTARRRRESEDFISTMTEQSTLARSDVDVDHSRMAIVTIAVGEKARYFARYLIISFLRNSEFHGPLVSEIIARAPHSTSDVCGCDSI
jgi:hypothetical protein